MSVIQTIRDRYARWAVIAIAVALMGFILMDAFTGRSRLFGGANSTTLGSVNGKTIDEVEFEKRVQAQEQQQQQQQQGNSLGEEGRQQIIAGLWKQEVDQVLLQDEYSKLGLSVGGKELTSMLYTDPHPIARQYLGDPQTGAYDPNRVQQIVNSIKRGKDKASKDQLNILLDAIEKARLTEKYTALVAGTVHFPKWLFEKQNADNSLMAKISYVNLAPSMVSDSAKEVAVSDKEISDYLGKHKDIYKTDDESRTIEYVLFSASPSAADTTVARNALMALKPGFDSTKNMSDYLKNNSTLPYYDSYIGKNNIKVPSKDSIIKTPVGGIYGPYVDGDNFVLAKMMDAKQWPDTVKVRHILIATQGQGQVIREDSTAKKLVDSIQLAIKNGANFDSLCAKYSDDPGSKDKGGVIEHVYSGQMVPQFNDFIFSHPVGEKGVVKSDFGYHYIEVLGQTGSNPAYKIAYISKKIEASDETVQTAENAALQFAGNSRDAKSFDANYEKDLRKKGILKLFAQDIPSHSYSIQGIGTSRKFIKEVFNADAGDVLQPERVADNYIVAVVTQINKAGEMSVAAARTYVEPVLRNKKKAEVLKKRIGKITTLEAVAAATKQPIQTADSLRFAGGGNSAVAYEYKVVGAAFNPANKGKVVPEALASNYGGVYVVRVDNVSATVVENADVNVQKQMRESQGRSAILMGNQYSQFGGQSYDPAAILRKAATIKDYRNKFY
jgi:peptidyl-prolyl cis-trans isomerase D